MSLHIVMGFTDDSGVNNLLPIQEMQEMRIQFLVWNDRLEKEMATRFGILAWNIPEREESQALQSVGLLKSQTWPSN